MGRLRLAVVGVGHLGKEHARILAGMPDVELVGVADVSAEQAQAVARRVGAEAYTDWWPLLNLVDAVTVVVPTVHHVAVASEFLSRGIPVLVEKPLAPSAAEAGRLVELAARHGTLLQVGHIERFNPAFERLRALPLRPRYVACERLGPFTGRSMDIGVVLDLMIHDLDLLLTLVGSACTAVEALGLALFGRHEDIANARLHFANGCVADVAASRASAAPCRRMRVWSAEGYVRVDFRQRRLLLAQLAEQGPPRAKANLAQPRMETLEIDCNQGDQLSLELQDFVTCVKTGTTPRVDGKAGHRAVALAERVIEALRAHRWEGVADGPIGPNQVPRPAGRLFPSSPTEAAA